jgi:small GTP-binding protein
MQDYLRVVVTGEVDSGKSTLIGRFLYDMGSLSRGVIEEIGDVCQSLGNDFEFAYLLDSFEEERRNQLTIDTTQVFCKTKRGKEFVFIDVPGHQELLMNMLCGSSYADIAILIVDVQKSIEDQTKRHAFILKFLGIEQVIIVLNKMDSVGFDEIIFEKVKEEIEEFFRKIQLQPKYFIPISAREGENLIKRSKKMGWYKGLSILEGLSACSREENNGSFRLPIQDIYYLDKKKLAVGKIISGKIKKGDKVKVLPINKECKIESINIFNKNDSTAEVPESIGLILGDMDDLMRGQVICKPRFPKVTTEILIKIFCILPLNIKQSLIFRCVTQEIPAQIKQINGVWDTVNLEPLSKEGLLEKTNFAEAIIVTEKPVVVERFDGLNNLGRFVLKNNKEICAMGFIL